MDKIMTIKDKILAFLKESGITQVDFFAASGIAASNFKGKAKESELGGDKIVKILTIYPNLSPDWLILDKGSMLRNNHLEINRSSNLSDKADIYYNMYKDKDAEVGELKEEIGALKLKINQLEKEKAELQKEISSEKYSNKNISASFPEETTIAKSETVFVESEK